MTRNILILSLLSLAPALALSSDTSCYNDVGSLSASHSTAYQSVAMCEQFCHADKKLVYAVQGEQCYCGDELPPASAQVSNKECSIRCPGYPSEKCGGPNTWTVVTHSNGEPRSVDSNNGIVTAPDEDGASDPLATLSVNPTMVKTATGTNAPKTSIPSSILTAPSAAADPNQGDAEASTSSSLSFATSAATAKASGSPSSPSFTPSATATGAAAGRPVLAASLVGAMLVPLAVNWL